jgi:FKBP-type peptidyl-prolyl cis-trans isomerase FklB
VKALRILRNRAALVVAGGLILGGIGAGSALAAKPDTELEKFSYALGYQMAQGMKRDKLQIDTQMLAQAIRDALDDKQPQLSLVEMRNAMASMQQKIEAQREAAAKKAKTDGEAFLAANKGKTGVTTLPDGIQYKVIKSGSGKQPKTTDTITAHYEGTLINGKVFDSSYRRGTPATFPVNQVIQGWQEILPLMHVGDKWQVYIPSDLAYGEDGAGQDIGPNETLIFDIELISIN